MVYKLVYEIISSFSSFYDEATITKLVFYFIILSIQDLGPIVYKSKFLSLFVFIFPLVAFLVSTYFHHLLEHIYPTIITKF